MQTKRLNFPWSFFAAVFILSLAACATMDKKIFEANCNPPDNIKWVVGEGECLKIETFRDKVTKVNSTLVVFIHGDSSRGGSSSYLYPLADTYRKSDVVRVALIRPGYYDGAGNESTGNNYDRRDNYTAHNIDAIAEAVKKLKKYHRAKRVILVLKQAWIFPRR